jgi:hypothetical protein
MILGSAGTDESIDKKVAHTHHDTSMMQASTEYPSDIMTSRILQAQGLPHLLKDST